MTFLEVKRLIFGLKKLKEGV